MEEVDRRWTNLEFAIEHDIGLRMKSNAKKCEVADHSGVGFEVLARVALDNLEADLAFVVGHDMYAHFLVGGPVPFGEYLPPGILRNGRIIDGLSKDERLRAALADTSSADRPRFSSSFDDDQK